MTTPATRYAGGIVEIVCIESVTNWLTDAPMSTDLAAATRAAGDLAGDLAHAVAVLDHARMISRRARPLRGSDLAIGETGPSQGTLRSIRKGT